MNSRNVSCLAKKRGEEKEERERESEVQGGVGRRVVLRESGRVWGGWRGRIDMIW